MVNITIAKNTELLGISEGGKDKFFVHFCSRRSSQKLHIGPYCRSSVRGIGYSFQLAITTPRINLIGYGTATAQSYRIMAGPE